MTDQPEYVRIEGAGVEEFLSEVRTLTEALEDVHQNHLVTLAHALVHQVAIRKGPFFAAAWLRQMADGVELHAYPLQGAA